MSSRELTHLSVRTLRRYHESGLLEPATVDPSTGYRYYTSAQIPSAQVIHRLRELDVPLAEVGEILATEDPQTRAELITGHLQRLEAQLDRTHAAVASLRQLLQPDVEQLQVQLRSLPARTVAGISGEVDHSRRAGLVRRRDGRVGRGGRRPRDVRGRPAAATPTSCSPSDAARCSSTAR